MKIAILGGAGRMGQSLLRCAAKFPKCQIVAVTERSDHPAISRSVREFSAISEDYISPDLCFTSAWPADADAIIDFTFHTTIRPNLEQATAHNQAYVLGTTGLDDNDKAAVQTAAEKIPLVWAPNMSLGINLLLELVRRSAAVLGTEYDVEIVEMHHRYKKDAPSGTALGLAEAVAEGHKVNLKDVACYGREGITGERPKGEIGIHALRGGTVVGEHTASFVADEERIDISHTATNRDAFATGAFRGALWLQGRTPGLYTMRHVLGFEE